MTDDFKKQIKHYAGVVAKAMSEDGYVQHVTAIGQDEMDSFVRTLARIHILRILHAMTGKDVLKVKAEDLREISNLIYLISMSMSCTINDSTTEEAEYITKAIGTKLSYTQEIIDAVTQVVSETVASMDVDPADLSEKRVLH